MAVNSQQPTVFCDITLFVLLSSLNNQDAPFLDFFVLSIVILVFPTQEFFWGGGAWRIWQLATEPGRGQRSEASERRRTVRACLPSAAIVLRFNSMRDPLSSHPLHTRGGRPRTDRHLGEGRGPRRLSDGEQSAHVCRPIGNRPAFQHHAGSPLQPPSPPRVGGRPGTYYHRW